MTNKGPGRPKNSFKWSIDGEPVKAEDYYKYKRLMKRQKVNLSNNQHTTTRINKLLQMRDIIESLISQELRLSSYG